MQTTSTSRCSQSRGPAAPACLYTWRSQQQQARRTALARFQKGQQSNTTPEPPAPLRQAVNAEGKLVDPAIPAPQQLQASVQLVPKETARQDLLKQASANGSPLNSFLVKCRLAWNLFFPPGETSAATRQLSPKELGKQRLSMILVADRCGLSPNSLVEMKRSTLAALQDCMDLEDLQDAHLRFTMTRENGVTYSMAVPILRPDPFTEGAAADADEGEFDGTATASASWEEYEEFEQVLERSHSSVGEQGVPAAMHRVSPVSATAAAAEVSAVAASADLSSTQWSSDAGLAATEQHGDLPAERAAATASRPTGWGAAAAGVQADRRASSRAASCAASRTGRSRGTSPAVELQLEGTAVMTPDMLKELLVEELVHDVEELVEHMGPQAAVRAVEAGDGVLLIEPTAAAADGNEADELAGQLEAAVAEVQHFGEGAAAAGAEAEGAAGTAQQEGEKSQ